MDNRTTFPSGQGSAEDELTALRCLPLRLEGVDLRDGPLSAFVAGNSRKPGIRGDLARFLLEWQSRSPVVAVHTSGSTGTPKLLEADKRRMACSARRTCAFLGIPEGATTLLAMPLDYIAGKMVVVRALVCGLDLVAATPSASPLAGLASAPFFAALTPMQAFESLKDPATAQLLREVRCLLLGGGAITGQLAEALAGFPHPVWSSYGMTETLSHIALRRVDGKAATPWYTPLAGVRLSLSAEGTLVIDDPRVCPQTLVTNDLAQLADDGRFRITGRRDNVIDSGGIKVQIEEVEAALEGHVPGEFCITWLPDERLGEEVVMLGTAPWGDEAMKACCRPLLPAHWCPRRYLQVDAVPRTQTGKPARAEARELALRAAGKKDPA